MPLVLRLFLTEMRRDLRMWWSYRLDTLGWIALWAIGFPLTMLIFDSVTGGYGPEHQLASWIGFLVWDLCMGALATATQEVAREAREGTLESVILSPFSPVLMFWLRIVALFVRQALQTLLLGIILALVLRLPVRIASPVPMLLALTVLSISGLSLALGGLTLVYKHIDSLVGIITLLSVLFTGALVPLNSLGPVFQLLKYLLPTTWGIDALRGNILHGSTWSSLAADGTLLGLGVQAAVFLLLGAFIFKWGFSRAQLQGSLGAY
ncbi:MAG: ABC transporter permease [Chloroflexota bacterium]